jgi:hypothetical protein
MKSSPVLMVGFEILPYYQNALYYPDRRLARNEIVSGILRWVEKRFPQL